MAIMAAKESKPNFLRALNPRERKFVTFYIKSGNATQAAIKAGYSAKTADGKAPAWVGKSRERSSNGRIWDAVSAKRSEMEEKSCDLEKRILREYERLAFFDIRNIFNPNDTFKSITQLDDDTAAALVGVDAFVKFEGKGEDTVPIELKKIKMADKKGALDSLAKIMGLFKKDNDQKVLPLDKLIETISAISPEDGALFKAKIKERLDGGK